jgi:hypothetical protein
MPTSLFSVFMVATNSTSDQLSVHKQKGSTRQSQTGNSLGACNPQERTAIIRYLWAIFYFYKYGSDLVTQYSTLQPINPKVLIESW